MKNNEYHEFTDFFIGERGTIFLSESLKSNTTLTFLVLNGEEKERKYTKDIHQQITHLIVATTDSKIKDIGATSLSESLKSNTTLTQLNLECEYKRKTHKRQPSAIHSFFLFSSTVNGIRERGATSLSESLKSNTTLFELNMSC